MKSVRVAVIDEHDIFRRGLVACLADDPFLEVVVDRAAGPFTEEVDVVVVSPRAAGQERFDCPIVVCGERKIPAAPGGNQLMGTLPRSALTAEQLIATVRAAAAGLRIDAPPAEPWPPGRLDERRLEVLRLLAEGADTQEISVSLGYSERTVKGLIQGLERQLGSRSRAQAVAEGIRRGLIAVLPLLLACPFGQEILPG
jgi:DNA-binding CsgD family transcriptional regulator